MALPEIATREEWVAARTALLEREKELTRARDAVNADRRRLPMVEITADYRFDGPDGEVGLLDLFEGRRQLMVGHFMFPPEWDEGCPSCSAGADEMSDGLFDHLHTRDTTLVQVSRAPLEKIEAYRARKGWTFPWYSSYGTTFNHDFGVTLDPAVAPPVYNFRELESDEWPLELPGLSCFLRDGERVFHTYSQYARGAESTGGSYYFLDLTALGRQEDWEEPKDRSADVRANHPDFAS
ncbi:DUF899 domain-containing protein [Pseudonocardia abyssalis]|uniref:DUF899 domain-containing protein n=1 Tax=Pseudonocardia abyssalis TaxID=2792008 RepID=A0ABS6UUX8_9PSEU|nr:DUF899 domain-containing protein [Pseudonocardia abyssalis]MBW0115328.1 DUF899 domain-containing protein [Pseudonocardia abyssalis]MBW0135658.1 DUF899 domain-containing protein [Pseudonocardia abyssalis]